jgi:hypothetical protein
MNADAAIALLRKVSIYELSGTDGCLCMSCEIQGIHIDVSCRKSSGSRGEVAKALPQDFYGAVVRVYSSHMDANRRDLQRVADVVCDQIKDDTAHLMLVVRLCSYEQDAKAKCWYCGKGRVLPSGYACAEHGDQFREQYEKDYC